MLVLVILSAILGSSQPIAERAAGISHRGIPLESARSRRADGRAVIDVTIWYPAGAGAKETMRMAGPPGQPLFEIAPMAVDATPERGRHPVILLSHGFGGTAEDMGWLAAPLARAGYVVISVNHPGNNALDMTEVGAITWWERPRDLIAALSAMTKDAEFGSLIDTAQVGVGGFSMGGATALALAGAKIDPSHFDAFCAANRSDRACQPPVEMPDVAMNTRDGLAKLGLAAAAARAGEGTTLPQVRAVLSIAPNAQTLAPKSLRAIKLPVVIIAGMRDETLPIKRQAAYAAREIPKARLITVPGAAHYSFMATCTDLGRTRIDVCRLAPEKAAAHRIAVSEALALFGRTLTARP